MINDTHFLMGYFSCQTLLDPLQSHRTGGSFVMFFVCLFVQQSLLLTFGVFQYLLTSPRRNSRPFISTIRSLSSRPLCSIFDFICRSKLLFILSTTTCSTPALLIFKTKLVLFLWFPVGVEKTSPNLTISSRTGDDGWRRLHSGSACHVRATQRYNRIKNLALKNEEFFLLRSKILSFEFVFENFAKTLPDSSNLRGYWSWSTVKCFHDYIF